MGLGGADPSPPSARYDGFAGWYDEHLAAPFGAAGDEALKRLPGISPDGPWAKVTGVHLPLGSLVHAFLDAPLMPERFEKHGDDDYPRRIATRARRRG